MTAHGNEVCWWWCLLVLKIWPIIHSRILPYPFHTCRPQDDGEPPRIPILFSISTYRTRQLEFLHIHYDFSLDLVSWAVDEKRSDLIRPWLRSRRWRWQRRGWSGHHLRSHEEALALFGPGIVFLIRSMDQGIRGFICFYKFPKTAGQSRDWDQLVLMPRKP